MRLNKYPDMEQFSQLCKEHSIVPLCSEFLADMETPVSIFAKLYSRYKGSIFLLESVEGGERWGKYSFIGIGSRKKVEVFADVVRISDGSGVSEIAHHGEPFSVLRAFSAEYSLAALPVLE